MSEPFFDYLMRFVVGVVLGGILGSFISMLTYRLPRGQSLIKPASSCPSCRKKIEYRDLVPLFSYWMLKGNCRGCGKPYGKDYFRIEVVSTVITTLLLVTYGLAEQGFTTVFIFVVVYSIGIIVANQGKDGGAISFGKARADADDSEDIEEKPKRK
jgi:leader peptidase (prepilin peptidase)/N-methyltransferase